MVTTWALGCVSLCIRAASTHSKLMLNTPQKWAYITIRGEQSYIEWLLWSCSLVLLQRFNHLTALHNVHTVPLSLTLWHDQKLVLRRRENCVPLWRLAVVVNFYTDLGSHVCCYYHCSSVKRYLITRVEIAGISKRTHIYFFKHQSLQSTRIGHLLQQ